MPTTNEAAKLARVDQLADRAKRLLGSIYRRRNEGTDASLWAEWDDVADYFRTAALAQAEGEPVASEDGPDAADIIAGALQCSRGYSIELMRRYFAANPEAAQPAHQVPEPVDEVVQRAAFVAEAKRRGWVPGNFMLGAYAGWLALAELRAAPRQEKP